MISIRKPEFALAAFIVVAMTLYASQGCEAGERYPTTLHRVKDGDTIDATVHLPFGVSFRYPDGLRTDYDCWETSRRRGTLVKGMSKDNGDAFWQGEIAKGKAAKVAFETLIADGELFVEPTFTVSGKTRFGAYGRPIVRLWIRRDGDWLDVAKVMRDGGHTR